MTRILFTLASISLILIAAALVVGLSFGDLRSNPSDATRHWATVHRLVGTAAALAVVLVESVVVTYFIGTSRWCKEVVETYGLNPAVVRASSRLKRRAFAWSLLGMLTIIVVIALGAASDPATGRPNTESWTNYHLVAAIAGMAVVAWTYWMAWQFVWQNNAIIDGIICDVARIRRERGLEIEPADRPQHTPRPTIAGR